jgi:peptidoglycan/LPS O-acetylase OafA/YrhL
LLAVRPIPEASGWFNRLWDDDISVSLLLQHLLFLGNYNHNAVNGVIWTLVHEMRISLLFPLLVWIVLRFRWTVGLALCPVFSVAGYGIYYLNWHYSAFMPDWTAVLWSMQFVPMFLGGAMLAKYREPIVARFRRLREGGRAALLFFGLVCYTYPYAVLPSAEWMHFGLVNETVAAVGACICIIAALGNVGFANVLRLGSIRFLGKISYSLYLYHLVVLLALAQWTGGRWWLLWTGTVVLSVALAALSHRFVELPSIRWGKAVASQYDRLTLRKPRPFSSLPHIMKD